MCNAPCVLVHTHVCVPAHSFICVPMSCVALCLSACIISFCQGEKEEADLPKCRFKAFVAAWEHCYLSWLGDSDTALGVREQSTFPPCSLHPISVVSDFWLFVQVDIFSHSALHLSLTFLVPLPRFCVRSVPSPFPESYTRVPLRSLSSLSAQVWLIGPSAVIPAPPQLPSPSIVSPPCLTRFFHTVNPFCLFAPCPSACVLDSHSSDD